MRIPTILALSSILAFSGCAIIIAPNGDDARFETAWGSNVVKGNGDVTTEKRSAKGVANLSVNGSIQVEVRVGKQAGFEVIADSNLISLVRTDLISNNGSDDVQKISIDGSYSSDNPIRVIYYVPSLRDVNANGSGRLTVSGLNGGMLNLRNNGSRGIVLEGQVAQLDISNVGSGRINASSLMSTDAKVRVQGSGSVNLGAVNGNELNVSVHGSGSVNASGNVRSLLAQSHGSGSADLTSVRSQSADLSTFGSGDVIASVSQNVNAQTTGSGHVTVYGNPAQRNVIGKHVSFIN